MKMQYEIKGVTLNEFDMQRIKEYYEAHCTAEYLIDNYELTEEKAVELGYDVRRLMFKYGYNEEEAIKKVVSDTDD
jgi:hypothetical protein